MNLQFDRIDDNALPLNANWSFARDEPPDIDTLPDIANDCNGFKNLGGLLDLGPNCTSQFVSVDEPRPFRGISPNFFYFFCSYTAIKGMRRDGVHGHVNWNIGTYSGYLNFTEYKTFFQFGDSDDNFSLRTDGRGYVKGNLDPANGPGLTVEFNRSEVFARLHRSWVDEFMRAAPRIASSDTSLTSNDVNAIVIGLIGVETKHTAHIELHPAYGIALRESDALSHQRWLIIARNWGSEGGCSNDQHNYRTSRLSFFLPNGFGPSAEIDPESWFRKSGSAVAWGAREYDGGALVTVALTDPRQHGLAYGTVDICRGPCSPISAMQDASGLVDSQSILGRDDSIVERRARLLSPSDVPTNFLVRDSNV